MSIWFSFVTLKNLITLLAAPEALSLVSVSSFKNTAQAFTQAVVRVLARLGDIRYAGIF